MEYDVKALPFVNNNGDTPARLKSQYRVGYTVINNAIEELSQLAPHGRNYQADHVSYEEARKEYDAHLNMLTGMRDRYLELYRHVEKNS